MPTMEKQVLEMMKRQDLKSFLKEMNIKEQELRCKHCNESLSINEVAIISVDGEDVIFSCSKPFCYRHIKSSAD